ncbi:hypothetical protein A8135_02275 [Legionella jamestowniensis]|uniref:histidine kinase n=1 Tax=Legionella jamestowniensis TaxID=455 RepID=A0ABX2XSZ1_9GAMM|nr:ATP-binding protein [Legionella jamestowniensis]OCH97686.1 hypothetical protein A8135_02275 [Legionella jamestowniensis]
MRHSDLAFSEVQKNIEEMANQLCLAVKGEFDFTIKIDTENESMQKLTMLVNFVLDTARRSLVEVREKNNRLMELDQLKSDFIANVSHELRTPLTLILAPLKTILENKNQPLSEEVLQNLQRIQRNAARLYTLVSNILDFSKLEAGKFIPHDELINLNAFISQLVDDAQDLAKERHIDLTFKAHGKTKDVLLDKNMLEKILLNLISNALKFTPAQGFITIELQQNTNTCILIRDSGTGIPKEQLPSIFDRFHQVDSSSTRAYEGTGIGLTVVKQFVELLQGTIAVESEVGKGTTFSITLPARFAKDSKKKLTVQARDSSFETFKTSLSTTPGETVRTFNASHKKNQLPLMILADDNSDIRAYIVSLLKDKFNIIAVENGKAALEAIDQSNPQIILSDIMMPFLDGYELTKILKSKKDTCHIPIILITAKAGDDAVVTSLDVGADDYLVKPFSPQELIARTTAAYKHYERYLENCRLNSQLLTTARRAGMADIATSILHNIGNVLNSANVSLDMIKENSNQPYLQDLTLVSLLLKDNINNLASYLTTDNKGKLLPDYLIALINKISQGHEAIGKEMNCLRNQIAHIKEVVAMQKSLSGISGVLEKFSAREIIDSAVSICENSFKKQDIKIKIESPEDIFIITDKAKLLQILINLIQNAIDAVSGFDNIPRINKFICFTVREQLEQSNITISVQDNGIGIKEEHQDKIFTFGFTTKPDGHGFGLHTSALAAKELGGSLQVRSKGVGHGAEFILTLPLKEVEWRAMHGDYEKRKNSHY